MTDGVFLSYSTRDRGQLDGLLSALRRAGEAVWFDEELGGGEVWWQKILERIRDCEVFLFALTDNSLESRPCLAELNYAQALQKPVLPIQIGPVQSMRVTPLAAVEAIDFQNPTVDSGIRLMTAIQRARRHGVPLPTPLPEEPPVPFAYLMRLATTITGPQLHPEQQPALLAELTTVIAQDGDDAAARRDIAQLLRTLHGRPDATDTTRTASERLLAQLGAHSENVAAPSPVGPGSTVRSRKWLIAGVAAVAVVAAVVAGVVLTRKGPTPTAAPAAASADPTTTAPAIAPEGLEAILLSAAEINAAMGATAMTGDPPDNDMNTYSSKLSDPDCLGADYAAAQDVYDGTGWSGVSTQILTQDNPDDPNTTQFWVSQAAVSFPTDRQAQQFLDASAGRWAGCSGRVVKETTDSAPMTWSFGDITRDKSTISQLSFIQSGQGWGCQHTLTNHSNAILEAVACGQRIHDQAARIVEKMVGKAQS